MQNSARSADAIVAQTNSATFAGTSESAQQLNITRLRALENAREIVSVSTVGISAHIDINGNVLTRTEENLPAQLSGSARANTSQTVANFLGGFASFLVIFFSLIFPIILRIVRSR